MLWASVVAYIGYAAFAVREHRAMQRVSRVEINIVDSSAVANLVTRPMVEQWINQSKVRTVDEAVDSLRLGELEHYISINGFVKDVKCYTSYEGVLHIEVRQLQPVLRIMLDGFNSYITAEGYHFARPAASSRYTQVVTGNYTPLFKAGYGGYISEVYETQYEELEAEIRRIEVKNIFPLYGERVKIREQLRTVNSRYIHPRLGEKRDEFEARVSALKERNSKERAQLTAERHKLDKRIEREEAKQKVFVERQKKLEKKYKDFINLIIFVNIVENDKFWSSEIVQIVAREGAGGSLKLELIPRSGEHTIIFGDLEGVDGIEEKLDRVKTFYREVLPHEGWDKFGTISVEYKNQVVCK